MRGEGGIYLKWQFLDATRRFRHRHSHSDPLTRSTLLSLSHLTSLSSHLVTATMADDSVPLPYPNLKVPQWQYQIASIPRLKEQASSSFWKAIEEDGKSRSDIRPELQ